MCVDKSGYHIDSHCTVHVLDHVQVCMGDVIEVDRVLETGLVRRGRLVVKEIGGRTRRGGYHISVIRYKTFALFHRSRQQ